MKCLTSRCLLLGVDLQLGGRECRAGRPAWAAWRAGGRVVASEGSVTCCHCHRSAVRTPATEAYRLRSAPDAPRRPGKGGEAPSPVPPWTTCIDRRTTYRPACQDARLYKYIDTSGDVGPCRLTSARLSRGEPKLGSLG